MSFGLPDLNPILSQLTAGSEAIERLAEAIDRLAAATEEANRLELMRYG